MVAMTASVESRCHHGYTWPGRLGAAGLIAVFSAAVVIAVGAVVYNYQVVWGAIPSALR
jgi:hypothetical protein